MMGARTLGALLLSLGLVACGSGSTPAPEEPALEEPTGDAEVCCCFVNTASGDFNDDYSMTSPGACEASRGTCVDGDTPGCPS